MTEIPVDIIILIMNIVNLHRVSYGKLVKLRHSLFNTTFLLLYRPIQKLDSWSFKTFSMSKR